MLRLYKLSMEDVRRARTEFTAGFERLSDHLIMNGLAAVIAACGLLQDSPAVIIGAMLIATLLIPITAMGFGAAAGEWPVFRAALRSFALSCAIVLVVSILFGVMFASDISGEMLSRTQPQMLDVMIGFAGGAAATWVVVMPRLSSAFVGAAIATALVPPLVTVGLFLSHGHWPYAVGALLLFGTNFAAIATASMFVYMLTGVHGAMEVGPHRWAGKLRWALIAALAIVVILLARMPY